ncbi:MAG: ADP-ribosylglycohydrolase family protein [Streptosporangiales bacterium]|nr:ADP-ribosylglycohydrolase family protein [Streptosporangiales bacterium]
MRRATDVGDGELERRAIGCVAGAAVGDALGGATEGWTPEQIQERYGGWVTGIVPPFNPDWRHARPIAPYHKGDGHVTDDTLMTLTLADVYAEKRDHLDAYDIAERFVPRLIDGKVWIPELEAEALPLHRIFLAEKWLVLRLHYGHNDPREAGVGNIVNCGAAMYMAPVGVVNAADPERAYAEAIEITGPHQSSYGREAAGVFAAAVATAMAPGADVASVRETCLALAKDGTRAAVDAVLDAAGAHTHWADAQRDLRAAMAPYDTVGDDYRNQGLGARRPSRLHAIEELPLALAMLTIAGGDYRETLLGAINYGRDADSIATMGGALAGALGGVDVIPVDWLHDVEEASRVDLRGPGIRLADVAVEVLRRDEAAHARRTAAMRTLAGDEGGAG